LSVKRLEDRTRLEVLELPLTNALTPISERAQSNGRFVAYDRGKEILDPAIFDEGTPITIVAEVLGTTAAVQVDESKQEYPAFRIRDLTVWPNQRGDVLAPTYRPPFMWGSYGYRPYNMW
jgi:starvation-inducible outer membrane lipoprotein